MSINRLVLAIGLVDLTDRDRYVLDLLASQDPDTVDAAVDLLGKLTRPAR